MILNFCVDQRTLHTLGPCEFNERHHTQTSNIVHDAPDRDSPQCTRNNGDTHTWSAQCLKKAKAGEAMDLDPTRLDLQENGNQPAATQRTTAGKGLAIK